MNKILRALALLAATALLCALCNLAACLIDTPRMRENAAQALDTLSRQDARPELVGGFASSQLDNFSTAIILKTAAYTGPESLLMRAFGGLRAEFSLQEGEDAWDAVFRYGDGADIPQGGLSYSRYWHGYMLPLRLLLCLLNLSNLSMLLLFAQLALVISVCLLMKKRRLGALLPGFITAYFLMMPAAMSLSLQYVPVCAMTLLSCIAVLRFDAAFERFIGLPTLFALCGLLTNYFDLLTFPLTALGFPLVLCLCLRLQGARRDFPELLRFAVACCAAWGAGYGGMWVFKWALNALLLGSAWLGGVAEQIALRLSSSSGGVSFSRFRVILQNLDVLLGKTVYRLLIPGTGLFILARALRGARRTGVRLDARVLVLLLPLVLPFGWYLALSNHAYDHTFFTYRNLAVSIFSAYAMLACALKHEVVRD